MCTEYSKKPAYSGQRPAYGGQKPAYGGQKLAYGGQKLETRDEDRLLLPTPWLSVAPSNMASVASGLPTLQFPRNAVMQ